MALPTILKELKSNGYHVVQVVAAGERPPSLPPLVASNKTAWPTVVKTSVRSGETRARRHGVKLASARKQPGAVAAVAPTNNYPANIGQF